MPVIKYMFYSIGKTSNYFINPIHMDDRRYLSIYEFQLGEHTNVYKRNVKGILEILGGTGGVMQILLLIFGYILSNVAEFHFK